jgi:geranylgeranyl diphosphate synthase, type II
MEVKPVPSTSQSLIALKTLIEHRLRELLPLPDQGENLLVHAMHTGILAPGKRTRALLMLLTARSLGGNLRAVVDLACAVEMVHTASLFMDDMPCMDNARMRRGQLASHIQYGEDIAMLAAVALLSEAYLVITNIEDLPTRTRSSLVTRLSCAVGRNGLANGQYLDLRRTSVVRSEDGIASVNGQKTGILFVAALDMAAMASRADDESRASIRAAAHDIGQAFQMRDDLEDGMHTNGIALKDRNKDQGKTTLVSLLGREAVQFRMRKHIHQAVAHLRSAVPKDAQVAEFVLQAFEMPAYELDMIQACHPSQRASTYSSLQGIARQQ